MKLTDKYFSCDFTSGECGFWSQIAIFGLGSTRRRSSSASTEQYSEVFLSLNFKDPDNNDTFRNTVCTELNSTVTTLILGVSTTYPLIFPNCIGSSSLTSLTANKVIIANSTQLPTSLTFIALYSITFSPNASPLGTVDFLDLSGNFQWDVLFSRCPAITDLTLASSNLKGELPLKLRAGMFRFVVSQNQLSGSIPSQFFSQIGSLPSYLWVLLDENQLSGSIQASSFQGATVDTNQVTIDLSTNMLTGALPENLFAAFTGSASQFLLKLASNQLSGLPARLFSPSLAVTVEMQLDLSVNQLTGTIAPTLFDFSCTGKLQLLLFQNHLSGVLPSGLFASLQPTTFSFQIYSNAVVGTDYGIIGPLPDKLFSMIPPSTLPGSYSINLNNNRINGTIPPNLFYGLTRVQSLFLLLNYNQLTGSIPETLLNVSYYRTMSTITIALQQNQLSGTLPSNLFLNAAPQTALSFMVQENRLEGTIPNLFPSLNYTYTSNKAIITFSAYRNNFTGISESFVNWPIKSMDVKDNPFLSFQLPPTLFNATKIVDFRAANTSVYGVMPMIKSTSLLTLNLTQTNLDFCSSFYSDGFTPRVASNSTLTSCNLQATSACNCAQLYPSCSASICAPTAPLDTPITAPNAPLINTPINPPINPVAAPTGCSASTRPSSEFDCINGVWTAVATIETPTLSIPSGASTIVVSGNLTSANIIFNSIGSTLVVKECASNLSSITIQLSDNDLKKIGKAGLNQTLVSLSADSESCSSDLTSIAVQAGVRGSSCRKLSSRKDASSSSLNVIFSVNTSACDRWWIILVSVICGIVVIIAIIFALLVALVPSIRAKVRPYSKKRTAHHDQQL